MQISMQKYDLLVFRFCHRGGISLQVLNEVAEQCRNGALPFVLFGDFNDTPDMLANTGWLDAMKATVVGPFQPTCNSNATCRNIDDCVFSLSVLACVCKVEVDWQVPFAPHAAIRLHLNRSPARITETLVS